MAKKDREIAELTGELRSLEGQQQPAGGRGEGNSERGGSSGSEGPAAADALSGGRDLVQLCLQSQAARLSQLAVAHDLRHADPSGEALPCPWLELVNSQLWLAVTNIAESRYQAGLSCPHLDLHQHQKSHGDVFCHQSATRGTHAGGHVLPCAVKNTPGSALTCSLHAHRQSLSSVAAICGPQPAPIGRHSL